MSSMGNSREAAARLLQAGYAFQQRGQLAEARRYYAQVLAIEPMNFDALQLTGLCCLQAGELGHARSFLDRALALRQDVASVFNHRGVVLRRLGERQSALEDFSRAIALSKRPAESHYNRANTLMEMGRPAEAVADYRRAVALEPSRPEFLNNLGGCLRELGLDAEALDCFDRLIAVSPGTAEAHANRGLVLQQLGRLDEALASEDRALALRPDSASAWCNRSGILVGLQRYEEALFSSEKALAGDPGNPEALLQRGMALMELGKAAAAAESLRAAIAARPQLIKARTELARLMAEEGRFSEAEDMFKAVLLEEPGNVHSLNGLADVRKYAGDDPLFAAIERRLDGGGLTTDQQVMLHHAYAKMCDDAGRYDSAMLHFARSKALRPPRFNLAKCRAAYAAMRKVFTREFFEARSDFGSTDERPVFIVGMPRSGTTLTEQILAAHPMVKGLGELRDMPRVSREVGGGLDAIDDFLAACAAMDAAQSVRFARSYQRAYEDCGDALVRLVDKRPHNYELLGLITLLFPKARIVHCRRGAMDNCLSMYMQDFAEGHGYNRDLSTLGHYYRAYEEMMEHWVQVLPLPIHHCVYEETVADIEGSARALVSFLGLEWDPRCLSYHTNERQVRTPSQWQVRQPVYSSSVERWRRYETHLGPLLAALGIPSNATAEAGSQHCKIE